MKKSTSYLNKIVDSFQQTQATRSKIYVQVSHCSLSVGAYSFYQELKQKLSPGIEVVVSGCDGACFAAPRSILNADDSCNERYEYLKVSEKFAANSRSKEELETFFESQNRVVMKNIGTTEVDDINGYLLSGGFQGLNNAFQASSEEVVAMVEKSGLRGRGGAYFPVASKWSAARSSTGENVLVINAEEGEPGVFKDRHLMEGAPFRVLEGALIAAYAVSATQVFVYVNAEATLSYQRLKNAINICRGQNLLGEDILGTGIDIDVQLLKGAGGYVCGEESTLINTMEGTRREPRLKPPFPTESGYLGYPTVVNNVETICTLPYILKSGSEEFNKIGNLNYPGTKIISLSGNIKRAGAIEITMGSSLDSVINSIGGGPIDGSLSAVAVGGPSSGIIPAERINEVIISPGLIDGHAVMVGAGGVIPLGKDTNVLQEIHQLSEYNASESCGKCTPCREGTPRIKEMIHNLSSKTDNDDQWDVLEELARTVNAASLCGLGQAAGNPALSFIKHFKGKR